MTETGTSAAEGDAKAPTWKPIPILSGLAAFVLVSLFPAPDGMEPAAWAVVSVGILMVVWWITEAIPVPATALVPILALPLLGVLPVADVTASYGDPVIFLFMGGFVLALAMERSALHRRVALNILVRTGSRQDRVVGGFMLATTALGMWVSNTATAVMMLPVALSVAGLLGKDGEDGKRFSLALLLAVAYAASIGGITTLIGSPPNAIVAGLMSQTYGYDITFARWMAVGIPVAVLMLLLCWLMLTRVAIRLPRTQVDGAQELIAKELAALGPWRSAEKRVAVVFVATASAWVFRSGLETVLPGLSDAAISIACAIALFLVPAGGERGGALMDWDTAKNLPWGVLVLFGGGLALASGVTATGVDVWIGERLGEAAFGLPLIAVVFLVVVVILFLTEFMSNTATAAAFVPLVAALAVSLGENPLILAIPATFAAGMAFMLPVATPPNALVYGTGHVPIAEMAKKGFWLNLIALAVITTAAYALILLVFDVTAGVVPEWASRAAPAI